MNSLLKKNLNKLMHINLENIKNYFFKSNRFFLSLVILTFLSFLYLLIPYSYNNNALEIELKSQLSEKFATNFIFSNKLKYIFFPSPHFVIEDSSIIEKKIKYLILKR